ncbi:hypothetical protein A1OQ_07030 [Enterovibrio norvegicus FF-162]|uniref:DUF3306 domain-containing protein n=1 Tax=Enterovibrio TaxID=188143 RepID=UPI0002FE4BAA|nr:DUF3306 domain-containing protein [Enterovibrio norvegicus]OEE75514.1 hypothetical protein A1OQ_07030 [Enterovibrio norvegicus FF-162]
MATDSFLNRWSKRKQAIADEELREQGTALASDEYQAIVESENRRFDLPHQAESLISDTELIEGQQGEEATDVQMELDTVQEVDVPQAPDMEDVARLKQGDSAASFLAKGVSAEIKKAALRKLFHTDAYNVLDGMNDYDLDYSNKASLSAEVAASLRQWTKEKIEDVQEGSQIQDLTDDESVLDQTVEQDVESTVAKRETKSTHDEERDNLSYEVRQIVPDESVDNNSDGS